MERLSNKINYTDRESSPPNIKIHSYWNLDGIETISGSNVEERSILSIKIAMKKFFARTNQYGKLDKVTEEINEIQRNLNREII